MVQSLIARMVDQSTITIRGDSHHWGHKIADFEFFPYISFIVAFIPSEYIKRYWESICGESK